MMLALTLALGCLTGCGSKEQPAANDAPAAEETKEEQQPQAATGDTVISVEDVPMTITTHSQDSAREENENDSQLSLF